MIVKCKKATLVIEGRNKRIIAHEFSNIPCSRELANCCILVKTTEEIKNKINKLIRKCKDCEIIIVQR